MIEIIDKIDYTRISIDEFLYIKKLLPEKKEQEECKKFKGDIESLDLPSRFFYEIKNLKRISMRFDTLNFQKEYEQQI